MIDIMIPTYGRPDRLAAVARNIHDNTTTAHRVQFIAEPSDTDTHDAVAPLDADLIVNERSANYAGAMNTAILKSDAPFWFAGADDLNFTPGWDTEIFADMDDQFLVLGTNDLANPFVLAGVHATHYLVDRRYIDIWGGTLTEGPGVAFFEGYDHNYTDTEFIGVAKARVRFCPCLSSVVEHLHFAFSKSEHDATYERGMRNIDVDRELYMGRKQAWSDLVV